MSAGSNSLSIVFDDAALNNLLAELGDGAKEAVRPAAQAGAEVLYQEVKRNLEKRSESKTGNLLSAIYQVYSKDNSSESSATYHVSWNARKAPHGHLVEYGYKQRYRVVYNAKKKRFFTLKDQPLPVPKDVPAQPFIRPAQAKFGDALAAAEAEVLKRLAGQQ